jgi:exonuclease III
MLNLQDVDICPRVELLDDLKVCLLNWRESGEQLIVMGDFNEVVRSFNITRYFDNIDMHEVILYKHGRTAPNTYYASLQLGRCKVFDAAILLSSGG